MPNIISGEGEFKDSAAIFQEQGRDDLAQPELDQAEVINQFLPEALSEEEIEKVVIATIESTGAEGCQAGRRGGGHGQGRDW